MTWYLVQPREIFVKASGFLSFAEKMEKNIGKNIGKYSQKLIDHAK